MEANDKLTQLAVEKEKARIQTVQKEQQKKKQNKHNNNKKRNSHQRLQSQVRER